MLQKSGTSLAVWIQATRRRLRPSLQTYPMVYVHTMPEKFEIQQSPAILNMSVFEEDSDKGSHMIIAMSSFARSSVLTYKRFLSTLKRKASVFKFLRLEERFQKAPFR